MGLSTNDRTIAGFTMTSHALVHWFETSIPIFLVVWLSEFDISVALLGTIVALGYAPFGIGALPGGILADRYGSKHLITLCLLGMSLAFLFLSLSNSLLMLAVGLVAWGVAASIYHPSGLALISTGVEERGTVFAWHGIAGNIGIALGPFVAATLLIFFDWSLVAVILAVPGIIAAVIGATVEFDPTAASDTISDDSGGPSTLGDILSSSRILFTGAFAVVFAVVTVEGLFYRSMLTYLPEILSGLPALSSFDPGTASLRGINPGDYIYVGLLVVGMGGQYVGGKLTDRYPPEYGLVSIFSILTVLALVFVPATNSGLIGISALCVVIGFFLFAIQPFYQEAVAVHTPPEGRGLSYGYTYLGEFGVGAASIAIGGYVLGAFSIGPFFLMLAGFGVLGGLLAIALWFSYGQSAAKMKRTATTDD